MNLRTYCSMALTCLFMVACQPYDTPAPDTADEATTQTPNAAFATFGDPITPDEAIPIASVLTAPDQYADQTVKVSGTVRSVCQNKGCWLQLDGPDGQNVRVTFRDYGFFVPTDIAGQTAILSGRLAHEETTVETLRHLAKDEGKTEAEIEAITEPKLEVSIVADGVLIAS